MRRLRTLLASWKPARAVPEEVANAGRTAAKSLLHDLHHHTSFMRLTAGLDEHGLPFPRRSLDSFYNAASGSLVALVDCEGDRWRRLFVRRTDESRYREVVFPREDLIAASAINCAAAPVAFVLAVRPADEHGGLDDGGLYRIALPAGTLESVPSRIMVHDFFGASPDGGVLYVTVAEPGGNPVAYSLAALDTRTGERTTVAPMPGIFV
jgi:hypothetical protein